MDTNIYNSAIPAIFDANSFMEIPNESKLLPKIIVAMTKNALDFYDPVPHFS